MNPLNQCTCTMKWQNAYCFDGSGSAVKLSDSLSNDAFGYFVFWKYRDKFR